MCAVADEFLELGVVALPTDRTLQIPPKEDIEIAEAPVKILETQGTFDEVIVWEHENLPAADDIYVKGVEEWMRFAETVGVQHLRTPTEVEEELT